MIERMKLDGFRTLNPLELGNLRPFNLLLGPNSSSKSNFLRALQFIGLIARGHELNLKESYIENEGYSPFSSFESLRPWGSESWLFSYEISLRNQNNTLSYEGGPNLNQKDFVKEKIKTRQTGASQLTNREGGIVRISAKDFRYEVTGYDPRLSVFYFLRNPGIITAHTREIRDLADVIVLEGSILTRRASTPNIKKSLYETLDYAFHDPEGAIEIKRVFLENEGLDIIWDKEVTLTLKPKGFAGEAVGTDGPSDGATRLLWWLCWRYMQKSSPVFLIEEIDNGLNPVRFRKWLVLPLKWLGESKIRRSSS